MPPILAPHVLTFLNAVAGLTPKPSSVWLIGSQASGRATSNSDTDLLVFGSPQLLDVLRNAVAAPEGIDCLVVFNRDEFRNPWHENGGSLSKWNWSIKSPDEAQYVGTKWEVDPELGGDHGNFVIHKEKAIRIWPL
jgi:hypothetical protein